MFLIKVSFILKSNLQPFNEKLYIFKGQRTFLTYIAYLISIYYVEKKIYSQT